MRIVIATGIFPPDIGGPATYSKIIAEEFLERGHNVSVVAYSDTEIFNFSAEGACPSVRRGSASGGQFSISPASTRPESGEVSKQIPNSKFKILSISRKMPKGIRHAIFFWNVLRVGWRADVIYAQDAVSAGLPAALAAFLLQKKFFIKIVGDHAWEQGIQRFGVTDLLDDFLVKKYGFTVSILRKAQRYVASRAERVIVPSEYLKSVVAQWGIQAEKIVVIPNAVSAPRITISKEEARKQLGLKQEDIILISVGRLVPWKGIGMLVELMPSLREKIPTVQLVIIGDGPERKNLESKIMNYELKNVVVLAGSLPKEKLAIYLSASDIFLLNSAYEGFSHQLIEAMAAGVPIIATEAGGNKEVLKDGENAFVARYNNIADWKEKILRLYSDAELYARLKSGNKDTVSRFSIEAMVIKTESILLNS